MRHWGCGAKEVRISQAAYRRFYYYLTTDEHRYTQINNYAFLFICVYLRFHVFGRGPAVSLFFYFARRRED